jgi:hypothetical protein
MQGDCLKTVLSGVNGHSMTTVEPDCFLKEEKWKSDE